MEKIKIKYFDKDIEKLTYIGGGKSNWIDLRSAETVHLKKGEFRLIPLGVGRNYQTDMKQILCLVAVHIRISRSYRRIVSLSLIIHIREMQMNGNFL